MATESALSLAAAGVWGGGDFAGGLAAKRANVFRVVAGAHACGLVFMLALAWLTHEPFPPAASLYWGAIAGITGGLGIAALYKALAVGRMGIVAPVAAVITGVLPIVVGIRSEGMPDRLQLAGFVLALVSIWIIARPDGEIDSHRGLGLAILAGVMFGLFLVAGKQAGRGGVFWPLVAARTASTLLMLVIVAFSASDGRSLRPALVPILMSRIAGFWRQRTIHCRNPAWPSRCGDGIVVALSREHGDSCAGDVERANLWDAERRHCGRTDCRGNDCRAMNRTHAGTLTWSAPAPPRRSGRSPWLLP